MVNSEQGAWKKKTKSGRAEGPKLGEKTGSLVGLA
jgi:hypothetical protein